MLQICSARNINPQLGGCIKELYVRWLPDQHDGFDSKVPNRFESPELSMRTIEVLSFGFALHKDRTDYQDGCQVHLGKLARAAKRLESLTLWGQNIPIFFEPGNTLGLLDRFIFDYPGTTIHKWHFLTKIELAGFSCEYFPFYSFLGAHKATLRELLIAHCVLTPTSSSSVSDVNLWVSLIELFAECPPNKRNRTILHDLRYIWTYDNVSVTYATFPKTEERLQNLLSFGHRKGAEVDVTHYKRPSIPPDSSFPFIKPYQPDDRWNVYKDSLVRTKLDYNISLHKVGLYVV